MKGFIFFLFLSSPALCFETRINGGRMELLNKGETIVFVDGVRLDRGPDHMVAMRMQTNKQRDKVTANGDVRLFRQVSSTETWHGYGDSGFYNTQTGTGYLLGTKSVKARVIHTEIISSTISRVVNLTADRIDFMRNTKRAYAKGFVQGNSIDPETGDRYDFWADEADFDGEGNSVTLFGAYQPIVILTAAEGRRTIKGDKIVYYNEGRRLLSEGHATAVFEDDGSKKKK